MRKIFILSLVLLSITVFSQPKSLFLNTKNYYTQIFSKEQLKNLQKNFSQIEKTQKKLAKAQELDDKAEEYKDLAKHFQKAKNLKKAQKTRNKASKLYIKAYSKIISAQKNIIQIYKSANTKFQTQEEDKKLIAAIMPKLNATYDSAMSALEAVPSAKNLEQKVTNYADASYLFDKTMLYFEYVLAVKQNDKSIIKQLKDKYLQEKKDQKSNKKDNPEKNQTKEINYNPEKDSLLFFTKEPKIDLVLNYNQTDLETYKNYLLAAKEGFKKILKAQQFSDSIQNIEKKVASSQDFMKKLELNQKKKTFASQRDFYLKDAYLQHLTANQIYFDLRKRNLQKIMPQQNTPKYSIIKKYLVLSEKYYNDAFGRKQKLITAPAEQRVEIAKKSNEQIITALQMQENALRLILGIDTLQIKIKNTLQKNNTSNTPTTKPTTNTSITSSNSTATSNKIDKKTTGHKHKTNKKITKPVVTGLFVYSYDHPTPHKASYIPGTVYRIQVGSAKYLLPLNELKDYKEIYFETFKGSAYKYFLVGNFSTAEEAKIDLKKLKAKGYKYAKIVKFVNGKRAGVVYAKNYSSQTPKYSKKYNATDITKTKYLLYAVQIGTFSTPKTKAQLGGFKSLYYKKLTNGMIQYFVAPYYRYDAAKKALQYVKSKGYSDALIVAFNNGEKINLSKAKVIENAVKSKHKIIFRVQVGAFSTKLTNDQFIKQFGKLKDVYTPYIFENNGLYIYAFGTATTFDEAKKIKQNISNLGYTNSFIIAFKGGKKVSLSEVLK